MSNMPPNSNTEEELKQKAEEIGEEVKERAKTITEDLEVAGNQLVDRVQELLKEGNVRRLRIKGPDGAVLLEMPVTVGAIAGGAIAFMNPILAALGAFAALVARVTIEITREIDDV